MSKNSEKANIIFIHKGNPEYLGYSLKQVRKSNPEANIYLLGDESNNKYDFIDHYKIADFSEGANKLAKVYEHMSTNTYQFELFCIQRWFILNEFVKKNNINQFFHADSDVLIFVDIAKEFDKFKEYDFTLSQGTSGHDSFWFKTEVLNDFCDFVENIYTKKDIETYNKLKNFHENYKKTGNLGGVCDMTFLRFYKESGFAKVGESTEVIGNSTYDHNFSSSKNGLHLFKSRCSLKKILWKEGAPYGKLVNDNLVKFNTLHLQGGIKKHIKQLLNEKNICPINNIIKLGFLKTLKFFGLLNLFSKMRNFLKHNV